MSCLGRVVYDDGEVSLLRLVPKHRGAEFREFVHPLRRRAAAVLSLLEIAFIIAERLVIVLVDNGGLSAMGGWAFIVNLFIVLALLFTSSVANPRQMAAAVHIWYFVTMVLRYITILSVYMTDVEVNVTTVMVYAMFTLLLDCAVGTTMHINFVFLFVLATVSFGLTLGGLKHAGLDEKGGLGMSKAQLLAIGITVYAFAMWSVHTVQYNTVMMFVWNTKYIREQVEIGKRKHIEELNRLHVSNALHDIGSPLQAFVNGLQEIRDLIKGYQFDPTTQAELKEAMDWMQYSVAVMSFARKQAIAYAKALWQMEEVKPKFVCFDLRELVHECLTMMKGYGRFRGVDVPILHEVDDAIPSRIRTDRTCVWESLTNYLSNAVKFTDEGSITVKVQIRPMPPPELASDNQESVAAFAPADRMAIHIEVADTGRGIPPGGEEHLFKPFSQLQTDSGGTGLGLVSVKTKVEMLGGLVGVQRNEPKGAIFWCDIPFEDCSRPSSSSSIADGLELAERDRVGSERGPPQDVAPPLSQFTAKELMEQYRIDPAKVRLLLVEDERILLKHALRVFTNLGFSVETASDGRTALDMLTSCDYDLVLMDQNMPNLGGLEVVRRLREWQRSVLPDNQTDAGASKVDQSRTTSASTASGSQLVRHLLVRRESGPHALDGPAFNPLIFMLSASILPNDREEAAELNVADFFEKPLQVSLVPQIMISRLIGSPARLQRVQRLPAEQLEEV